MTETWNENQDHWYSIKLFNTITNCQIYHCVDTKRLTRSSPTLTTPQKINISVKKTHTQGI